MNYKDYNEEVEVMKDVFKIVVLYFGIGVSTILGLKVGTDLCVKLDEIRERKNNNIDNGTEEEA
jgi:hypothetical protein